MNILVIDIGGTHVKVMATGQDNERKYDVISIGYPGPVLCNRPIAEPWNLGKGWVGFDFEAAFRHPVKVLTQ